MKPNHSTPLMVRLHRMGDDDINQQTIYTLLDGIRKRPGMYLGRKSLTALQDFLLGYDCAFSITNPLGYFSVEGIPPFGLFEPWAMVKHFSGNGETKTIGHILRELQDEEKSI